MNERKKSVLKSSFISLVFTVIIISIFNFEPHENPLVTTVWMKNIMLGVLTYIAFFVLIQTEFIVESHKKALREKDEDIEYLKDLLVEQIGKKSNTKEDKEKQQVQD